MPWVSVRRPPGLSVYVPRPEAPYADKFPVRVGAVVEAATERCGAADAHDVEAAFDRLVMDVGGVRHGEPSYYHLPFEVVGLR